jgi:hypothetical protein
MFISTLKQLIEGYDLYGEHRLNTLKSLFILTLLEAVNLIYGIQNPYFNFFYVPFTALTLEMTSETLKEKYTNFFHAIAGSIVAICLFDILVDYPLFFIFFVFIYSLTHYIVAIHFIKGIFVPFPIALSLAAYSLTYGEINTDWYIALNNSLITIVAFLICMVGLVSFPRSYYYRSWLRAYIYLLKQITNNFIDAEHDQPVPVTLQGHLVKLVKYANLLPKKIQPITELSTIGRCSCPTSCHT